MTSDNQTHAEIYLGIIDHVDDHAKVLGLAAMGLRLARLPEPVIDDQPEPIKPKPKPKPKSKGYAKRITPEQAYAVACPLCGAEPGERCYIMARGNRHTEPKREEPQRYLEHVHPHKAIHAQRKEAAR